MKRKLRDWSIVPQRFKNKFWGKSANKNDEFLDGFEKGRKFMEIFLTKEFEVKLAEKEKLIRFLRNELYLTRYEQKKEIEIIDLEDLELGK